MSTLKHSPAKFHDGRRRFRIMPLVAWQGPATSFGPVFLRDTISWQNIPSQLLLARILLCTGPRHTASPTLHVVSRHRSLAARLPSLLFNMRPSFNVHIFRLQIRYYPS